MLIVKNCVYLRPHPHLLVKAGPFGRLPGLHTWLQSASKTQNIVFIDSFNLF